LGGRRHHKLGLPEHGATPGQLQMACVYCFLVRRWSRIGLQSDYSWLPHDHRIRATNTRPK